MLTGFLAWLCADGNELMQLMFGIAVAMVLMGISHLITVGLD